MLMNLHRLRTLAHVVALFLASALCAVAASTNAPGKAHGPGVPTFNPVEIPQSVFAIPASPKDGRNPFFPQLVPVVAPVVKPKEGGAIDMSGFLLNGITSPPRRTAMINGRTFEPGEEGEVKLPNGTKVLIKCGEIGTDSAVIQVNGVRRELRLRFGL